MKTMTIIFQNKECFTIPRMWISITRTLGETSFEMKCKPEYATIMEQDKIIAKHNKSDVHGTLMFHDVLYVVYNMSDYTPDDDDIIVRAIIQGEHLLQLGGLEILQV